MTGSACPGYASCQRINIMRRETEEEKDQAAKSILDADDLVVGRENVFSPEAELVVLVLIVVMWIVRGMGSQFSGSIHRRKN